MARPSLRDCACCSAPVEMRPATGMPSVFTFEICCHGCGMRSAPSIHKDPEQALAQLAEWWNRLGGLIESGRLSSALSKPGVSPRL